MLLSSFFTRSMVFAHIPRAQLLFALLSETFLTIRQNSLNVTVCMIARSSCRGYFIHSLSTLCYYNAPSLATRLTGDYRDQTFTGKCGPASLDTQHKKGFYVYAKPNKCDPKIVTKYIGRYLGRPVIATSRIDRYDGKYVTFHYNRHEDNKYVEETIPVMEFIQRLIRHIPEKHFKMIRYGGIYARHRDIDKKLRRSISKEKHRIYQSFHQWRTSILLSFGYDPLECPVCKHKMEFLELYYAHKRVSLEEMYEKAMSRSRGKRSSA